MAKLSMILPYLGLIGWSLGNTFIPVNGNAIFASHGTPYFEEVYPESTFTVDNSTLIPVISPDGSGVAIQTSTSQFHTHVNFRFPAYINERNCLCQLSYRIDDAQPTPVDESVNSAQLELFELDSPTNETHHPNIAGYQGRWIASELVRGSGVAYTEFGIQPFDCSTMKLGGLLVGYEVAPKWWDADARVNISWSGKRLSAVNSSSDALSRRSQTEPSFPSFSFPILHSLVTRKLILEF
jgi:hypothetical protein